ncbi:protein serine/threonine phosphatase 2C [Hesseltinella vesiculosa]|uniref:Protein phosphatase n=1 Tax=Hesseltinella vesiculosa TaxID=101127 RepID=A0A1X2GQI8_9FUNG|nr:protein serine/threonine phosphatase 2C [Hesseltinella vesiculosa]
MLTRTPWVGSRATIKGFPSQWLRQCYSAAAISQQEKQRQLPVIDFFDPELSRPPHHYLLHCGVAGFPKADKIIDMPNDDNIYTSKQVGDDAYFQRNDALGVADGVGGWRSHTGANPALYSRKLMHYAQVELDRIKTNVRPVHLAPADPNPIDIMDNAFHLTTLDAQNEISSYVFVYFQGIVGSTTACIVLLCQDELRIANLGDCGISVIRQNNYVFRSEEQQHSFNFPYQLGTASFDSPTDAQQFTVKVQDGDLMILASDGLFDNLYDEEIMEEIETCLQDQAPEADLPAQAIADALAFRAKVGGKADDITVLVALIKRDETPNVPTPPPLP